VKNKPILAYGVIFIVMFSLTKVGFSQDTSNEGFARFLFNKGEYYRAITEYYKILYNTTDSTKTINTLKNMALCYFYGADYEGFINFFHNNKNTFLMNSKAYSEMNLFQGKSYYHLSSYTKAISILEKINFEPGDSLYDEKHFIIGLSYAHLYDWETALKKMEPIINNKEYLEFRDYLFSQKKYILSFPKRDPTFAGILSAALPGSGYFYCNRITTGITSLIVNGLLFWSVFDAAKNKQYGLSAGIGFFGLGWYIGNIIGSVNAAHQYNSFYQEQYLKDVLPKDLK
jgi:tetratricopeptide (TPR) repeat protein